MNDSKSHELRALDAMSSLGLWILMKKPWS